MNTYSYQDKITEFINNQGKDSVFVPSDFATLANKGTVNKTLQRLVADDSLIRVLRGVYYYPRYIDLLKEESKPNPNDIANAIARNSGWTIVPSGDAALNILGLSTQVVASWIYYSNGPYKKYNCDGFIIEFKHRANREVSNLSYKSAIVVQALKALGKENVDINILAKIKMKLSVTDKNKLLSETNFVSDWIYEAIKIICEDTK